MPSMRWAGARWHLPTDAVPMVAAIVLLFNLSWVIIYLVIMLAVTNPTHCTDRSERTAAELADVWGIFAFFVANIIVSFALIAAGTRGQPLTPSRRWLVPVLLYIDVAKYVCAIGYIAWALWYVEISGEGCWSAHRKAALEGILWASLSVIVLILAIVMFTYNAMASKPPDRRWKIRIKLLARLLGCYRLLVNAQVPSLESVEGGAASEDFQRETSKTASHERRRGHGRQRQHQQQRDAAEVIGSWLARLYSSIDIEKSDIVTGLTLVGVMQAQQRRALAAVRLEQAGVPLTWRVRKVLENKRGDVSGEIESTNERLAGSLFDQTISLLKEECQQRGHPPRPGEVTRLGRMEEGFHDNTYVNGNNIPQNGEVEHSRVIERLEEKGDDGDLRDRHSPFWRWLQAVSSGSDMMLTPPRWAAVAAPMLAPRERASILTGLGSAAHVDRDILLEAAHWAVHASAAYGTQTFVANATHLMGHSAMRARIKLSIEALRKKARMESMPEPIRSALKGRLKYFKHFVGGQKVAGIDDEDVLYTSFVNQPMGSTPYFIVRDRHRKAVVLSIRGTASFADIITDLVSTPTDILDWLPEQFIQAAGLTEARAHGGILAAAKAVLADLERNQVLQILLNGEARHEEHGEEGDEGSEGHPQPEELQKIMEDRGVDVRGWPLVVCGHSLGAAIASLLAPFFLEWAPGGVHVWAFSPPGGLLTAAVAEALAPTVTSVSVGKDIISRTSTVTFELLQDQAIIALALTKLCKTRIFLRFRSSSLRSLPPDEVFYTPEDAPAEALRYARAYFRSKCQHLDTMHEMVPPGKCIFLRRLKRPPSEKSEDRREKKAMSRGDRNPADDARFAKWEAIWVDRRALVQEGILLSRHQASDHYTQTLMKALAAVTSLDIHSLLGVDDDGGRSTRESAPQP